ncbi:hypothetical protein I7H67_08125 [Acinetobacter sp. ACIN00229]|uniref:DUF3592 domain-containing protein n=1 Tax=Acinetobacter oleivorans (strain JCM 16667 / KCTC 23045 / DR1) TaxID=436717 RepID=A0AAN0UEG6_ACISD|nr:MULTISPECIES: hypothetical protein [Acinetobacter]ADI92098.1 hypothetical protein AOLE_16055 [Acinetobacter oleivorans DR1]ESK44925.1 hypothetical protein P254_02455 [Acinetobacter oleivorans CIP 110421]MBI0422772.1 hypothetical protein [Acinetobacter sp. ACIN00229]MBJ9421627.1 hypothetical protein [Acinetobacter oleivorans]MCU4411907.1 hypothetical protein [Acinetobacter oleivorans]
MKLFIKIILSLLAVFLILLVVTSSFNLQSKVFKLFHPDWIEIKDYEILDYNVYCKRKYWRRGMDRSARGDIRYQYTYQNKVYKSEEKDFLVVYRLFISENCDEMKDQNVSIFNEIKKKNEIKVFISPDTKKSKILITKKGLSFRNSWMINLFLEIQLIFLVLIGLIVYLMVTSKK